MHAAAYVLAYVSVATALVLCLAFILLWTMFMLDLLCLLSVHSNDKDHSQGVITPVELALDELSLPPLVGRIKSETDQL